MKMGLRGPPSAWGSRRWRSHRRPRRRGWRPGPASACRRRCSARPCGGSGAGRRSRTDRGSPAPRARRAPPTRWARPRRRRPSRPAPSTSATASASSPTTRDRRRPTHRRHPPGRRRLCGTGVLRHRRGSQPARRDRGRRVPHRGDEPARQQPLRPLHRQQHLGAGDLRRRPDHPAHPAQLRAEALRRSPGGRVRPAGRQHRLPELAIYCNFQTNSACGNPTFVFKTSNFTFWPVSSWGAHAKAWLTTGCSSMRASTR